MIAEGTAEQQNRNLSPRYHKGNPLAFEIRNKSDIEFNDNDTTISITEETRSKKALAAAQRKREARECIEDKRWTEMNALNELEQKRLSYKQSHSQITQHSVAYNLINFEYLPSEKGENLKRKDEMHRDWIKQRASNLYRKNNSFDPIKGTVNADEKKMDNWHRRY